MKREPLFGGYLLARSLCLGLIVSPVRRDDVAVERLLHTRQVRNLILLRNDVKHPGAEHRTVSAQPASPSALCRAS